MLLLLMLVGADVPGSVLKQRQEGETQFLDNLSNDKMHAHIHCIYLFISTHTMYRLYLYLHIQ